VITDRLTLALMLVVLPAACGTNGDAADAGGSGSGAVAVTLTDSSIEANPSTVSGAGSTGFAIDNAGTEVHEFEVFRTDLPADALPVEDGVVSDEGLELVDEVEDIAPVTTAQLNVELEPRKHVAICNLPDHSTNRMRAGITVGLALRLVSRDLAREPCHSFAANVPTR
jgi:uncharacterized cupredoxin-like copper-binding protein